MWIIDPLDGTTNFIHGLPVYAVSIALAHRGQVQQAVVYDPTRNDLFFASRGRGAFSTIAGCASPSGCACPSRWSGQAFRSARATISKRYMQIFGDVMQHCAGCAGPAPRRSTCYVAAGYYDGFFETGLNPWDAAAGSLMITEAGGLVGNFTGEADYLHPARGRGRQSEDLRPAH